MIKQAGEEFGYDYEVSLKSMGWYLFGNFMGSIVGGVIFKFNPARVTAFQSINKWYYISKSNYIEFDDSQESETLHEN